MSTIYQLGQDISWRILRLQIIIALEFKTSGHYRCREYQLKWERLVHVQTCRSRLHLLGCANPWFCDRTASLFSWWEKLTFTGGWTVKLWPALKLENVLCQCRRSYSSTISIQVTGRTEGIQVLSAPSQPTKLPTKDYVLVVQTSISSNSGSIEVVAGVLDVLRRE